MQSQVPTPSRERDAMIDIQPVDQGWNATVRSRDRLGAPIVATSLNTCRESAVSWALDQDASFNAAALDEMASQHVV